MKKKWHVLQEDFVAAWRSFSMSTDIIWDFLVGSRNRNQPNQVLTTTSTPCGMKRLFVQTGSFLPSLRLHSISWSFLVIRINGEVLTFSPLPIKGHRSTYTTHIRLDIVWLYKLVAGWLISDGPTWSFRGALNEPASETTCSGLSLSRGVPPKPMQMKTGWKGV